MNAINKRMKALAMSAALLPLVLALGGCATGSTGGRIDPYSTKKGENYGDQVSMPALLEFSDETAQKVLYDLMTIPEIRDHPTKLILELGVISNETRSGTVDFEIIERKLRSSIRGSSIARENFIVVENRQRMDREKSRLTGSGQPDLLQEGSGPAGTAIYKPEDTLVLTGTFLQSERRGVSRYSFEISLINLASRQIVYDNFFIHGQEE